MFAFALLLLAASGSAVGDDWTSALGLLEECLPSPGPCLKSHAVRLLDAAAAAPGPLPIAPYLTLAPADSNVVAPSDPPPPLPNDDAALDEALQDRVARLLQTRTLHITIPGSEIVEGRKKKSKGMGMLLMAAMAMKGMMLQMAMGKIAMIAGKALLIGKMALLLSAIVGLKKLLGGGGGHEHAQVVYATEGGHGGGWSRSIPDHSAQTLAYRAQARSNPSSK